MINSGNRTLEILVRVWLPRRLLPRERAGDTSFSPMLVAVIVLPATRSNAYGFWSWQSSTQTGELKSKIRETKDMG
jgi:hypothetical protein